VAGRDRPSDWDPDDWFAESEPSPPRRVRSGGAARVDQESRTVEQGWLPAEDWLSNVETSRTRRPRFASERRLSTRSLIAAGAFALVLLLIGLAAAGVFSTTSRSRAGTPSTSGRSTPTRSTRPKAVPVQIPTTTLKLGDHGPQVRALQRALASLGYSTGGIDGHYGAATMRALASFQRAKGLTADGILGPATRAALTRAVSQRG
jgi:murein L,D-transpeptidase YcbB/YkuD